MKKHIKSNTIQFLTFLSVTQAPVLSDPIWTALADTGLDPRVVASIKVAGFILGALGVWWGRSKAKGPL